MASTLEWMSYASLAVVVIVMLEIWMKNRGLPPGPWGLPFFGYYLHLEQRAYVTLVELAKKFGNVFSFRTVGGRLFIVLNGIDAIKEVLVSRADEFIGRPLEMNILKWVDDGYGIVQEEGEAWREQRRFFSSTAKSYGFGKLDLEDFMHEVIQEMVTELNKVQDTAVYLFPYLTHVTSNVISRVLTGQRFLPGDPKIDAINAKILDMILFFSDKRLFLTGPVLEHIVLKFTTGGHSAAEAKRDLEQFACECVEEHIRTLDVRSPRDFIDSYLIHLKNLEEKGQLEKSSFSVIRLQKIVFGMYMEGATTVSGTISSMLDELAKHQDAQKKAQKSIDEVIGNNRLPSWSDRKNLPFIDALILELYRSSMVFSISTYYSNFEETKIRGYRIPKRSFIIANLYSVNNDPKVYPEPEKFDPERFLGGDGQRVKQEQPIPFGVGKRSCIGESLATMEVFVVIASILQHFTLHPTNDGQIRLEPRSK